MTPTRTARRIVESGEALSVSNAEIRALAEAYLGALEQAAQVCESRVRYVTTISGQRALYDAATAIRALGQKQPLQGEEDGG